MSRKSLASEHPGWGTVLRRCCPTLLGVAAGTLSLVSDGVNGSPVTAELAVITLLVAVAYLPIGAIRRQLGDRRVLVLETMGVLVFAAVAFGALLAEGQTAQYLLAAAWLGHGAWDVAHHVADRVVPRWYAEICAILDVLVAVGILLAVPHV